MELYNEKCLDALKTMESNSIDAVVTDPPYGLKFMGKKWDYNVPDVATFKELLRVMKPGATLLCFAGTRTQHRMAINIEDAGFLLKDTLMWIYGSGFPKASDISKQIDKKFGAEREVVGKTKTKSFEHHKGSMMSKETTEDFTTETKEIELTKPKTEEAKKWDGWKSHGLKPAYEPIIMAIKPNEGSYAENALEWGIGGINIDECRVPYESGGSKASNPSLRESVRGGHHGFHPGTPEEENDEIRQVIPNKKGRFPANIILTHHPECDKKCHDDCPVKIMDSQSGVTKSRESGYDFNLSNNDNVVNYTRNIKSGVHYEDEGGASRFFYCSKPHSSEKNTGTENIHPTVKPVKLMEYLCKMVSMPEKITVLDPYMGSGTTGIACVNIGLDFIGIEKEKKYFKVAQDRLSHITEEVIEKPKRIKKSIDFFFK